MTDSAARIHDALRTQGLVPQAEDVHFIACSTDYRTRMIHALADEEEIEDLKYQLQELQREHDWEAKRADGLQDDLDTQESELFDVKLENKRLRESNADLQDELASVRQELEDARKAATQETAAQ